MAESLIRFCEALAEPIFPNSLCGQYADGMVIGCCDDLSYSDTPSLLARVYFNCRVPKHLLFSASTGMQLTAWCRQSLQQLSPSHFNCFVYLVAFVRELLHHKDKNKCSVEQLCMS
jgi:hypothetical protein